MIIEILNMAFPSGNQNPSHDDDNEAKAPGLPMKIIARRLEATGWLGCGLSASADFVVSANGTACHSSPNLNGIAGKTRICPR